MIERGDVVLFRDIRGSLYVGVVQEDNGSDEKGIELFGCRFWSYKRGTMGTRTIYLRTEQLTVIGAMPDGVEWDI